MVARVLIKLFPVDLGEGVVESIVESNFNNLLDHDDELVDQLQAAVLFLIELHLLGVWLLQQCDDQIVDVSKSVLDVVYRIDVYTNGLNEEAQAFAPALLFLVSIVYQQVRVLRNDLLDDFVDVVHSLALTNTAASLEKMLHLVEHEECRVKDADIVSLKAVRHGVAEILVKLAHYSRLELLFLSVHIRFHVHLKAAAYRSFNLVKLSYSVLSFFVLRVFLFIEILLVLFK